MNRIFFQITIRFKNGDVGFTCVSEKKNAEDICRKYKAMPTVKDATFKPASKEPNA